MPDDADLRWFPVSGKGRQKDNAFLFCCEMRGRGCFRVDRVGKGDRRWIRTYRAVCSRRRGGMAL